MISLCLLLSLYFGGRYFSALTYFLFIANFLLFFYFLLTLIFLMGVLLVLSTFTLSVDIYVLTSFCVFLILWCLCFRVFVLFLCVFWSPFIFEESY